MTVVKTEIRSGAYYDSLVLLQLQLALTELPGVLDAGAAMGTEANKAILKNAGLLTPQAEAASPDDLILCVLASTKEIADAALGRTDKFLGGSRKPRATGGAHRPRTLSAALKAAPEANLAVISVAGRYAAREARLALQRGLHVFLFSDNVPLEDEIALKTLARERGLFLMGPDAGTAIVNGVALGFANAVPRGSIGLVAASGTGLQAVTSLVAREGCGVSQAIGVGGRDLKAGVGGLMMLAGLEALQADAETAVIVLISKPPDPLVAEKVLAQVRASIKPAVVCFLGGDAELIRRAGTVPAATLDEAALLAAALARGRDPTEAAARLADRGEELGPRAVAALGRLQPDQRYLRGLFSGGTFCYEALLILRDRIGAVNSNVPLELAQRLPDANRSRGHTCVDLGDDSFTQGRLHPMLDPDLRNRRVVREARDPETAVVLLDVVLGHGVHPDPAGAATGAIREAQTLARNDGREILFVASVCGTEGDPQGLTKQERKLRDAGVLVVESNAAAARLAGLIVGGRS